MFFSFINLEYISLGYNFNEHFMAANKDNFSVPTWFMLATSVLFAYHEWTEAHKAPTDGVALSGSCPNELKPVRQADGNYLVPLPKGCIPTP